LAQARKSRRIAAIEHFRRRWLRAKTALCGGFCILFGAEREGV
jgi:hypothetical protein